MTNMEINPAYRQINLTGIEGWFTYGLHYREIVNWLSEGGRLLEIGVYQGRSTCYMANLIRNSRKKLEFHCCDTFQVDSKYGYNNNCLEIFEGHLKKFDLQEYVQIHKGKSSDILASFPNEYFDYIFIDGDHNYEGFRLDVEMGLKKLRHGGRMAGHDILTFPSIRQALLDLGLIYKTYYHMNVWEVVIENCNVVKSQMYQQICDNVVTANCIYGSHISGNLK